jgi:hypothetical protein
MRILAFIEDREVIKAILRHLGLWLVKSKPAPKAHAPPARNQDDSEPVEGCGGIMRILAFMKTGRSSRPS